MCLALQEFIMQDDRASSKKKWRTGLWTFAIAFTILIVGAYLNDNFQRPYVHPQFYADPYFLPKGCEAKTYFSSDKISIRCADERYVFKDWKKYGLIIPGRSRLITGRTVTNYYRVGSQLILIRCQHENCIVGVVERDVFIEHGKTKEAVSL
jgi:Ni/Co efflux regulator RcnB